MERTTKRKETFIVPDYQRGYRWVSQLQVSALLEDILDFMLTAGNDRSKKYCLQPLVVTRSQLEQDAWEVIDGQQRLTTLYLILRALGEKTFDLKYETRPKTTQFLQELVAQGLEDHSNPDFHYISEAWIFIRDLVENKMLEVPDIESKFKSILTKNVSVIWYDVESGNRRENIEVFNRLNAGKIPLTDSELVKALLLCKSKNIYQGEELTMRQSEISNEFYRMESELRKPLKWGFLNGKERPSHTDLLLDLIIADRIPDNLTPYLWFEKHISDLPHPAGPDEAPSQRSPEETKEGPSGTSALDFWKEIKTVFGTVDAWLCESDSKPSIYHYAGFLLASGLKSVEDIYVMAKNKGKRALKRALREAIVEKIREELKIANVLGDDDEISLENLEYGSDSAVVKRLLLLLNVLTCEKITSGQYNRFPFERFVADKWSIEHIYPQNPDTPMQDRKEIRKWLDAAQKKLKKILNVNIEREEETDDFEELKRQLDKMAALPDKQIDLDTFNKLRNDLLNVFVSGPVHGFANLALLTGPDNAVLNNAPFPVKRDRIIGLEKSGKFIPPCTRNIFLKFYSDSDGQPCFWSNSDQEAYLQAMEDLLKDFLEGKDDE